MATILLGFMSLICIGVIYHYESKISKTYLEYLDAKKTMQHYKRTYQLMQDRVNMYGKNRIDAEDTIKRLDETNETLIRYIDQLKAQISELKNQIYIGYKNGGMQ